MDRLMALRASLAKSQQALASNEAARKAVSDFDAKVDAVRKKIVATTEGGAITGEERLREHTDQLYGAILSYEGRPTDYQIARIASLQRELDDIVKDFAGLLSNDLPKLNEELKGNGQPAIEPPPAKVALNETETAEVVVFSPAPAIAIYRQARCRCRQTSDCSARLRYRQNRERRRRRETGCAGARPSGGTCFRRSGLYRCDRLA